MKNVTEQISTIETERIVNAETLAKYLPQSYSRELPVLYTKKEDEHLSERDLLYKVLFDMRKDITDLKKNLAEIMQGGGNYTKPQEEHKNQLKKIDHNFEILLNNPSTDEIMDDDDANYEEEMPEQVFESTDYRNEILEESLSIQKKEEDLIRRALNKHHGKRKNAAHDLGISERTLYRKIKEFDIK